tara:strand:+ start:6932 stop:7312 length:381 start_codon:yes stop_codon:yes gene_type:complete
MSSVTENELIAAEKLQEKSREIKGVREIQTIYGNLSSDNYEIFTIINRKFLQTLKNEIDKLIQQGIKPDEDGKREYIMIVNNVDKNPIYYLSNEMKNSVIDSFKGILSGLDDALEIEFNQIKEDLQ